MRELIEYLSRNGYTYFIHDVAEGMYYEVTIIKNGHRIVRNYTYDIDNVVNPRDLIEDVESEFR